MSSDAGRTAIHVPDRAYAGLVTHDAKDLDTSFPPIEPLRPPGAPNVLIVLIDEGDRPIPAGQRQVRMEFADDGGGLGKGDTVTLYLDGAEAAEGIDHLITPEERVRLAMARQ